jgi:hypothetical protein
MLLLPIVRKEKARIPHCSSHALWLKWQVFKFLQHLQMLIVIELNHSNPLHALKHSSTTPNCAK